MASVDVLQSPIASPVAQQLVVAQCAVDGSNLDGDHQACVAPHSPVFYDRLSVHSSGVNTDVLEVSACDTILEGQFGHPRITTSQDAFQKEITEPPKKLPHFVGIAQTPVTNGADVRAHPEAAGRIGVAIGGLVSVAVHPEHLNNAHIGDYIRYFLSVDTEMREKVKKYTFSGAPKEYRGVPLFTSKPRINGMPGRTLEAKKYKEIAENKENGKLDRYIAGTFLGRIFQFGPAVNEVQVLLI